MIVETPPSDAGVKDVVVLNPDGQRATLKNAFTYNAAPIITRVMPDNGRLAGGTRITIQGSGFLPGSEVLIGTEDRSYRGASSVEVISSNIINAVTPPGEPGPKRVTVFGTDKQMAVLSDAFTYNPMPVINSITPGYGSSSGGVRITIEGVGFMQGARVMIDDGGANTQVEDDMTIKAVTPTTPPGVWDVRVVNPDTQEAVKPGGFISVGEIVYNYPNPFRASEGTTFRYVTDKSVQSVTVRVFNMAGVPIDIVRQVGSNEVRWYNDEVHAGLYIYLMEVVFDDGKVRQFKNMLEVYK